MLDMMFVGRLRIFVSSDRRCVTIEANDRLVARFGQIEDLECEEEPERSPLSIDAIREQIEEALGEAEGAEADAGAAAMSLRALRDDLDPQGRKKKGKRAA